MAFEFVIPLSRDDLTQRSAVNQYVVDEVFTVRVLPARIQECRSTFRSKGPLAVLNTFDAFYSVLRHFYSTDPELKEDAWDILMKAGPAHSSLLVEVLESDLTDAEKRIQHLNAVKMSAYLVCQFIDIFEAEVTKPTTVVAGKGRKKTPKTASVELGSIDWDYERERAVRNLLQLLQLHIHRLWDPPVVEEEFVNLIANCCYKLLENPNVSKNKATRDVIFQLLGTLVKKYSHGLGCSLKFVQLLQHFEHLASPLASALEIFTNEFQVTSVTGDIMREIGRIDPKDLARDTSGTRAYAAFLVELAEKIPAVMRPNISVLLALLDGESYTMRNSVLGVLGEMVVRALSREDLDDKEKHTRDQFLDKLEDHLHDVHAFARSKVLQIWLHIITDKALPLPRQHTLTQLVIGRLHDKSSSVRKYAIQVLTALLSNNPFAAKLPVEELKANYEKEKSKLEEMAPDQPQDESPEDKARKEAEDGWAKIERKLKKAIVTFVDGDTEKSDKEDEESDEEEGDEKEGKTAELITDEDSPDAVKDRVLAQLKEKNYADAVKLYSCAVEAFPGNPYFKAGEGGNAEENAAAAENEDGEQNMETDGGDEEEENGRVAKLLQGLKVVYFCETLSHNIMAAVTQGPAPVSEEQQRLMQDINKQQVLVQYLKDSLNFIECVQKAIPTISQLLGSKNQTDVLEAVHFFVTGFEFGVTNTMVGIRRMMALVWSREASIKDAVVTAYRRLYLHPEAPSPRARAVAVTANLTALTIGATIGDLTSLEELVAEFVRSGDLDQHVITVLWERFALKIPATTPAESRGALQLLSMAAGAEVQIVRSNVEVLVKEGLGSRGVEDFLLARDVCLTLNKLAGVKKAKAGSYDEPNRFPQDHEIFERLVFILVNGVKRLTDPHWLPLAEQAITLIYKMAEHPDRICGRIIKQIAAIVMATTHTTVVEETKNIEEKETPTEDANTSKTEENTTTEQDLPQASQSSSAGSQASQSSQVITSCESGVLTRLLSVCGHVALRQLVLLDCDMFNELKRRHGLKETDADSKKATAKETRNAANKRKSILKGEDDDAAMEEELGLAGAVAEDAEADYIRRITETQLLSSENLLGLLRPLLVTVCSNQVKYPEPELRAAASLALTKFMMVSSVFCEEHLPLLFTILEKSAHPHIRANIVIALGDLNFRFPNLLEPWTPNLYARLRDESPKVRKNTLMMLTHLILNDMVKVKGQISELATCIVDEDERIVGLSKLFFFELARKGNAIYNIMPDVVSRLSDTEIGVDEDSFRLILKYLFSFIQKERQSESLVEKLCHRFRATNCERQWRDMAFCLSMLTYSEKSIRKLQENFTCFHDKLHDEEVYNCFMIIINGAKKFAKPEARALVDELEERLGICHSKGVEDAEAIDKATKASRALREKSNRRSPKKSPGRGRSPRGKSTRTKKAAAQLVLSDDEDEAEDFLHPARRDQGGGGGGGARKTRGSVAGVAAAAKQGKKGRHKPSFSSDESESDSDVDLFQVKGQQQSVKENGQENSSSEKDDDSENKDPNMSGDSSSTAEPKVKKSRQKPVQKNSAAESKLANGRPRRSNRSGIVK